MISRKCCRFLFQINRRKKPWPWKAAKKFADRIGLAESEIDIMGEAGLYVFGDMGGSDTFLIPTEEGRRAVEERHLQSWIEFRESLSICISLAALLISLLTYMSKTTVQEKTEPMPPPQQLTTQAPPKT